MRELEGDVTAADKDNPLGQLIEFHELVAVRQVLFAPNIERRRPGARRHDNVLGLKHVITDLNRCLAYKSRSAVNGFDPCFEEAALSRRRERIRESSLEADECMPVNQGVICEAFPLQAPRPVNCLSGTDKDLFGITATLPASAAKRSAIDYRDSPTRCPAASRNRGARFARPDDYQVERLVHRRVPVRLSSMETIA